ncbi:MAG: ChaB family protein [Sphingobacteriia bacterium]|nr:ChaB family protein [Sphingobacteriia bacterium]
MLFYTTIANLPNDVKSGLSPHLQEVYIWAFNRIWKECNKSPFERKMKMAHNIAWNEAKKFSKKDRASGKRSAQKRTMTKSKLRGAQNSIFSSI